LKHGSRSAPMKKEKEWKKTQNVKKSRNESEKEKGIIN
jgi:hypothetical protein